MLNFLENSKRYLREFVEIGFLAVLAIILVYLILGQDSGAFVSGVADNVAKFVTAVTAPAVIGIAIIAAMVYLLAPRWR
jgi:hypothetical protein